MTLEQFLAKTNPHPWFNYANNWFHLDEYLFGNTNWREVSMNVVRPRMQRFLFWALELSSTQKQMGWSDGEWSQLSSRDMALFYCCLFFYPTIFGLAYLILLKKLSNKDLEAKLIIGGLC